MVKIEQQTIDEEANPLSSTSYSYLYKFDKII